MFSKDWRYDKLVDLIETIGYRHRTGNYYVIREHDGYINISYHDGYVEEQDYITINFHKNVSHSLAKNGYKGKEISETFNNFEDFLVFINKYHSDLFRKVKIKTIKNRIQK